MCVRWLGCLQGGLAVYGLLSIAETRRMMDEFRAFSKERFGIEPEP